MVISRRRFAENGKKMYRNAKKHEKGVQSFCFCSLNMQILWRCRSHRVVYLKLPTLYFGKRDGFVSNHVEWTWDLRLRAQANERYFCTAHFSPRLISEIIFDTLVCRSEVERENARLGDSPCFLSFFQSPETKWQSGAFKAQPWLWVNVKKTYLDGARVLSG